MKNKDDNDRKTNAYLGSDGKFKPGNPGGPGRGNTKEEDMPLGDLVKQADLVTYKALKSKDEKTRLKAAENIRKIAAAERMTEVPSAISPKVLSIIDEAKSGLQIRNGLYSLLEKHGIEIPDRGTLIKIGREYMERGE